MYCHQIWINLSSNKDTFPPAKFQKGIDELKKQCEENGVTYKLWKNSDITDDLFMKPEWKKLYDSYPYPIQRIDMLKYLILYKYGGLYFDIDLEVKKGVIRGLADQQIPNIFPTFGIAPKLVIKKSNPIHEYFARLFSFLPNERVINNNFMFMPYAEHPFMITLMEELENYKYRKPWELKAEYIFSSTGPNFLMDVIKKANIDHSTILNTNLFHDNAENSWNRIPFDSHDFSFFTFLFLLVLFVYFILNKH